jgi:hypothetical protein
MEEPMKSTQLASEIKKLTGATTNEAAVEAVQAALEKRGPQQPFGVLLTLDPGLSGHYWSDVFGASGPVSLEKVQVLKGVCQHYAEVQLGSLAQQLERSQIEAEVRAELEAELKEEEGDE